MAKTPRVVHVITGLGRGGAEIMLTRLVTRATTFESEVVSLRPEAELASTLREAGIRVHSLGMLGPASFPAAGRRLRRLIQERQPDVVQTWLYHADVLGSMFVPRRIPLAWNIRCADVDMSAFSWHARLMPRLGARLSDRPRVVIVNSQAGLRAHERLGYHPRRWEVIPNGFQPTGALGPGARDAVRRSLGIPSTAAVVTLIARNNSTKDYENFLRAAKIHLARDPSSHLVLVGRGSLELTAPQQRLLAETEADRIHRLGERADVADYVAAADIATLSSYTEGFPNVVGEAMAAGVPCVVTDAGDAALIVGGLGIVVPTRDPTALADGWHRMLARVAAEGEILRTSCRRRIEQNFQLDAVAARYSQVYNDMLAA